VTRPTRLRKRKWGWLGETREAEEEEEEEEERSLKEGEESSTMMASLLVCVGSSSRVITGANGTPYTGRGVPSSTSLSPPEYPPCTNELRCCALKKGAGDDDDDNEGLLWSCWGGSVWVK